MFSMYNAMIIIIKFESNVTFAGINVAFTGLCVTLAGMECGIYRILE